jgi:hypothetical protein
VEAYLLPALAAVGQQSLLAADPRVAYQVFADALPVDPAVQQKVQSILPRLGAHDFEQRQQATADLRDLGTPGALALLRLDRAGLNPEQLSRIDDVLAGYQTLTPAQVRARRDDVAFLLDCLMLDEPALRRLAKDRLDQKLGRTIAFDLDAPETVRIRQVESLRAQLLPPPATRGSAAQ